jgi:glycosyltransferase involved in cell wall biosynthesis
MMELAYIHPDDGGCTYYRVNLPLDTMNAKEDARVHRIVPQDNPERIQKLLEPCDMLVFPRPSDPTMVSNIAKLHEKGKKAVVDFDDNLWEVSPLSPHYADYGLRNVQYKLPDEPMLDLWTDGKGFDIEMNKLRLQAVRDTIEAADLVTTTTEYLAQIFRQWNSKVAVLPNCLDLSLWQKLPLQKRTDSIRLYWSGGSSHYEDITLLSDVFPVICKKYPEVKIVIVGHLFKGPFKGVPEDRIEFHQWSHTLAYPYKSAILDADISLIPLQDTEFNRSKSAIKWIEQSALSVPSVVSHVTPYKEMDNNAHNNALFVENHPDAWIEAISLLIEDPLLRIRIGLEARRTVEQHYDINKEYVQWLHAYQGLLNRRRPISKVKELHHVQKQHH